MFASFLPIKIRNLTVDSLVAKLSCDKRVLKFENMYLNSNQVSACFKAS